MSEMGHRLCLGNSPKGRTISSIYTWSGKNQRGAFIFQVDTFISKQNKTNNWVRGCSQIMSAKNGGVQTHKRLLLVSCSVIVAVIQYTSAWACCQNKDKDKECCCLHFAFISLSFRPFSLRKIKSADALLLASKPSIQVVYFF